jgi:NADPH:quinone reductase-like Zn-dependent oxidoreductase
MRALVQDRYGGADVLRFEDLPAPQAIGDQVLVRVHAASLNAADLEHLHGRPGLLRPFSGLRRPRNRRVGVDVAGRVEAIGDEVSRFRPGDEVFADLFSYGMGSLSELVSASERAFLAKPASMSMQEAATFPHAAVLAIQGFNAGRPPRAGERVLINGASGNVGPFAIQIARAHAMHVTGVASGPKLDFVRSIGANDVIDYTRESFARSGKRWDRISDISANRSPFEVRGVLTRDGVYTVLGGTTPALLQAMLFSPATRLTRQRMGLNFVWKPFHAPDVETLVAMFEAGKLRPIIDRTFAFDDAIEAVRHLEEGRARGKIVIRMTDDA